MVVHRLLQRMESTVLVGQALDGRNFMVVGLHGEHQAGAYGLAVEQDGAGAADAVLAADMGAGQRQIVTQKIAEQQARFDKTLIFDAVHRERDVVIISVHRAPADRPSAARAR